MSEVYLKMQARMVEFYIRYILHPNTDTFINRQYVYINATGGRGVPEHALKIPESHSNEGEQI